MGRCDFDSNTKDVGWNFCPSLEAPILFAVLYGLTFVAHCVQAFRSKKIFCWVIIMASSWLTSGYAVRAYSAKQIRGLGNYIPQQLLIVLAPLWINAFVYMVVGRMIYFLLPQKRIFGIKARRLTLLFVMLDIIAFIVQGSASSLMTSDNPNTAKIGIDVFRSIYRLIEFSNGAYSSVATHEAYFYCFESLPILAALTSFNIVHPSTVLVGPNSEFPAKDPEKNSKEKNSTDKTTRQQQNDQVDSPV
ncbi:hypothetical protein Egran_01046 [Elaphomyces granulatus]|uniref:RTA1 domain protein n=1 Tax=Elaphomyces granulatus TaxID=519963 RepID=A0A232M4I8_9EURO|nr:hypothetical protein Egran_01046 [Elaphomyces granulatus]